MKYIRSAKQHRISLLVISIPIVISAYTHVFNAIGFPCIHPDEGKYIRRGLHLLDGLALQDSENQFDHGQYSTTTYDHPYLANLFLGGIFMLVGYPINAAPHVYATITSESVEFELDGKSILESIEILFLVPRVLMGLLAIVDTFLIYKITQIYYNTNNGKVAALLAAILFAVMPLSWMTRRIYLDSILLPFLLSSILLAVYYSRNLSRRDDKNKSRILAILLSGIFLGIAIFTKVPAIVMIPLVASLIFLADGLGPDLHATKRSRMSDFAKHLKNKLENKQNLKNLGIWFIPVISIPLIWPAYALYIGEFDDWVDGVSWQAGRREGTGIMSLETNFNRDPVLIILGLGGVVFSLIRKDLLISLAFVPFLIFASSIGWMTAFHWIMVIPILCIAASVMLTYVLTRFTKNLRKIWQMFLTITLIGSIAIFGLISTILIISVNTSSYQFEPVAFAGKTMLEDTKHDKVTIIIAPEFAWVFEYFFKEDNVFQTRNSNPIVTEKIILVNDRSYKYVISDSPSKHEPEDPSQVERLKGIFNSTRPIAIFIPDKNYPPSYFPYNNIENCGIGSIGTEIRTNY